MGRKTFDSIFVRLSKPLPNRRNIVITRDKAFATEGVVASHSLSEAISAAEGDEVFVIGGASIYREALPEADRIYMTQVDADIEGDAYFPELEVSEWTEREREHHAADEKNPYEYDFVVLERVQG